MCRPCLDSRATALPSLHSKRLDLPIHHPLRTATMAGARKLMRPPLEYVQYETLANANVRLTWLLFNCLENRPTPDLLHSPILGSNLMSRPRRTPSNNNCTTVCDCPCDHLHRRYMCIMRACICTCGMRVVRACVRACVFVGLFVCSAQ
jgi:hypothetical protein